MPIEKNVAKHDLFSLKTSSQASSIHEGVQFAPLVTHNTQGLVWTDLSWGAARPAQTKMFVPTKIIWMQDMRNFKIDYTSIPHVQIIAVNLVKNLNIWVEKLILAETNKSNVINLIQVKSSMCWRPLCISGVCCRSLIVITRRLYWLVWKISNKDI